MNLEDQLEERENERMENEATKRTKEIAKKKAKETEKKALISVIRKIAIPILFLIVKILIVAILLVSIFVILNTFFSFDSETKYSSVSSFDGDSIEEMVWLALRSAGYTAESTAGVMGNIQGESGFDPDLIEAANRYWVWTMSMVF